MLSPDLLRQIRHLEIRTSHLVTEVLAGDYQSTFKGRGMEFEESRVYVPGDDVRNIDWNTTARTDVPHVKNYREERELTITLLVDLSASGKFGSVRRMKNDVAAEFAAIVAHMALRKNDKVGVILFTDRIEKYIPPKKGRAHVWQVVRSVLAHEPQGRGTHLALALDFLNQVIHKKSVVFLISDFLDKGFERNLSVTNKRHDLIAVTLSDRREEVLPPVGMLELEDAETGEVMILNSNDEKFRRAFSERAEKDRADLARRFLALGIDHVQITTQGSTIEPLMRLFRRRLHRTGNSSRRLA